MPVERIRDARRLGLVRFAENRVQDAVPKMDALADPELEWHLVGRLQANKARRAVERFAVIQSVDSVELAERLDRLAGELGRTLAVYLQVNVDDDPAKAGFGPDRLTNALGDLLGLASLRIAGLMTVGRVAESADAARPTFRALRSLSEGLRARSPAIGPGLSMGMTADFEVAIEEGATIVRVGRAIFGERPAA